MATDNNIKNFSAADIEKYHKGLLSDKERHDLEKAALDDPFLTDALEGYAFAGTNVTADINDLRTRIAEKSQDAKVIPIKGGSKTSFPWLRVAAAVIIIGGLGLLANQFLFTDKKSNEIAKLNTSDKEESGVKDSVTGTSTTAPGNLTLTVKENISSSEGNQQKDDKIVAADESLTGRKNESSKNPSSESIKPGENVVVVNTNPASGNVPQPAKTGEEEKLKQVSAARDAKEINKDEAKGLVVSDNKSNIDSDGDGVADKFEAAANEDLKKKNAVAANRRAVEPQPANNAAFSNQTNIFRGQVTDSNNIGLPFARVYNPSDNNAGTYTDVRGYFNLVYPDTVLNVQVKSIGFENNNIQLRSSVTNNRVVLQDDRRGLSEVVLSNQKPNSAARSMDANIKLEEPEPADGWDNYDTYIANNLDVPDEIKTKPNASGQVQVSFEVNKDGEPFKFKIEKSLCGKCDKEAIRLIKQGPKWKRSTNKNGRTTVTINF
ncbi:MAG: carboxypeptidase-like regulatory domain-containing protein [Sphingobacteriales bacterium]|nr:carboxypeptidase-like regulatory domain-containing protein [Sphingobacteriales bacterium]